MNNMDRNLRNKNLRVYGLIDLHKTTVLAEHDAERKDRFLIRLARVVQQTVGKGRNSQIQKSLNSFSATRFARVLGHREFD